MTILQTILLASQEPPSLDGQFFFFKGVLGYPEETQEPSCIPKTEKKRKKGRQKGGLVMEFPIVSRQTIQNRSLQKKKAGKRGGG